MAKDYRRLIVALAGRGGSTVGVGGRHAHQAKGHDGAAPRSRVLVATRADRGALHGSARLTVCHDLRDVVEDAAEELHCNGDQHGERVTITYGAATIADHH